MSSTELRTSEKSNRRRTVLHQSHGEENSESWLMSYADFMTLMCSFFVLISSMANMDDSKVNKLAISLSKYFNEAEMKKMESNLAQIKEALEKDLHFGTSVKTKITENGLEIMFTGSAIFESGKADILEDAAAQLDTMIEMIKKKNRSYKIIVEGHTDDAPIKGVGVFTSNRDLSSARAARIVDRFQKAGFDPTSMISVGYGETRPLVPNKTEDGKPIPDNMQMNRRVVIKILDVTSTEKIKDVKDTKKPENTFFNDQKIINN